MGQSTDGLLWWGLCWQAQDYEQGMPFPIQLHIARKLEIEGVPLEGDVDEEAFADMLEAAGSDSDDFEEEVTKRLEGSGCELVFHCSGDYTMWGIARKEHSFCAWRGDPKVLPAGFEKQPVQKDVERLKHACALIGWPWTEPRWWLASNWG